MLHLYKLVPSSGSTGADADVSFTTSSDQACCVFVRQQVQMRDTAGFLETRQQILKLKPGHRPNWISVAVAHHLSGRPEVAAEVLGAYEQIQVPWTAFAQLH